MLNFIALIKSCVLDVAPDASFIHGRSFDSALDTHISYTEVAYVFLDPIQRTGTLENRKESYSISIGFIKQDSPDSSTDEMDQIVEDMDNLCMKFLQKIFDINILDNGFIAMFDDYSIDPIYRIKNVCTGVLCKFTLAVSRNC